MARFLRLLEEKDKASALGLVSGAIRSAEDEGRSFTLCPTEFSKVPGTPFCYWISDDARAIFEGSAPYEGDGRAVRVGLGTSDDFRFLRCWWEISPFDALDEKSLSADQGRRSETYWFPFAKGGPGIKFYTEIPLVLAWGDDGQMLKAFAETTSGTTHWSRRICSSEFYFRPGITWPLRAREFCPQVLPAGCIFSVRGYSAFPEDGQELATLAIFSSRVFDYLFKVALGRFGYPEFIVGVLQKMPWVEPTSTVLIKLSRLSRRAWSLKRTLGAVEENSHAFVFPSAIRSLQGNSDAAAIDTELDRIQVEIDNIAFDLYGISEQDRHVMNQEIGDSATGEGGVPEGDDTTDASSKVLKSLLAWCVGVAFGRFDCRLTTGDREVPPEPEPFDPLPIKSPGMLPDGDEPFHQHTGILVDDPGHPHDLSRLVEAVLERAKMPVPADIRRWLQRGFFKDHLSQYSKSGRKAPIYWPLSTASADYTLWVYYPTLTSQTLYIAINDVLEPKLKEVADNAQALRSMPDRGSTEEKEFTQLQDLELGLKELRETILGIAKDYAPNHEDGVQITAAPLWPLFRHKPWQKVLKDTWKKLEKGDYDWAHLAMNYWPDRVRDKCKTDKSLAIAHDLEDLYSETSGN